MTLFQNICLIYLMIGCFTNLIWIYKIPTIRFETLLFMMFVNPFIILFISIVETIKLIQKFYKYVDRKTN